MIITPFVLTYIPIGIPLGYKYTVSFTSTFIPLISKKPNAYILASYDLLLSLNPYKEKDLLKAHEYYLTASNLGHAEAQFNLACNYYYGTGVEIDYKKAFEWWTKSAEQGYAVAQTAF